MKTITTVKGHIRVNKIQTGWSLEKVSTKEWVLLNFDDEIVFTAPTKKSILEHYETWYVH